MVTTLKTKLLRVQEGDLKACKAESDSEYTRIVCVVWDLFYLNSTVINTYFGRQ